jgi:hypothetical protein
VGSGVHGCWGGWKPGLPDQAWGAVSACKTKIRATRAPFRSGIETIDGVWGEDMQARVYMAVGVVGNQDHEIKHGGRFWPAKPNSEPCGLSFNPGHANPCGACVVDIWGRVVVVVDTMGVRCHTSKWFRVSA